MAALIEEFRLTQGSVPSGTDCIWEGSSAAFSSSADKAQVKGSKRKNAGWRETEQAFFVQVKWASQPEVVSCVYSFSAAAIATAESGKKGPPLSVGPGGTWSIPQAK